MRSQSLFLVLGLAVLCVWKLPAYLDAKAKEGATHFCESIKIGEPLQAVFDKVGPARLAISKDVAQGHVVHYRVWFNGFLGNFSTCDFHVQTGNVISRYTEDHRW